ncbi:hypothetical protein [Argonema antarcticum]|uniref:hypothetical protein n=1 Tax=Argonema antarcticum TaxID=2942763 RepID=UPI0020129DE7|nr:hypothetical protein [Argonema antarcticum]MCL1475334.1 hypothetical protein [Argonema antarcticum A004/B2]
MKKKETLFKNGVVIVLGLSLLLNIWVGWEWLNAPEYKIGILKKDLELSFDGAGRQQLIKMSKGLSVRNEMPRGLAGVGTFLPYRFSITIATDDPYLVDYSKPSRSTDVYTVGHLD